MAYLLPSPVSRKHPCSRKWRKSRPLLSAHLRQHSRNRGMVEGCGSGWPKGRSADRGSRRGCAAHRAGDAREPGVALICGRDEAAIEVGRRLADCLDITVLLTKPGDVTPRHSNEFPVLKGSVRMLVGISASLN